MAGFRSWKERGFTEPDIHNIMPGLFLGSMDAAMDLDILKERKISHILVVGNLAQPYPTIMTYQQINAKDEPGCNLVSHFHNCAKFIDNGIDSGGNVLVHCAYGISRSSTIVIAYLMEKQKMSFLDAHKFTKEKRNFIEPNIGFISQLQLFEKLNCVIDESSNEEIQQLIAKLRVL